MEIKRTYTGHLLGVTLSVAFINFALSSFFIEKLKQPIYQNILSDGIIILLAGFLGMHLALKHNLPLWWRRIKDISLFKQFISITSLGLIMIISNSIIYYYHLSVNENSIASIPWLQFSNMKEIILLSLRAGITEEIVFRLFIFTFAVSTVRKIIHRDDFSIVIGIIISALSFVLLHGGFNIVIFIYGIILAYIYLKNGLVPAIIVHFLSDAIPWAILFYLNK
ncbi:CPBP family intramembrane glutamic endopeptidase [Serpentinicella alkaliphila]|uniref:CAAX prenyl protease-like protein n=1 Tax=Serpentinicella alkaliphila TaxID=1734049 RepID=A0A4R2TEA8_9FIRM|nr:CPBP family intramembrane glutamic endopeptidase [Serpentinicella alkaliphila]QUH26208.1 CPBP family intramembrane metalloprotease [Serpentinicella alkaliphila]TCQ01668.1 CAAX prenyl protease-like protein [Serpentinicella alkaliphila]